MTEAANNPINEASSRTVRERVRSMSRKHWLGIGASPEQKKTIDEVRRQYFVTASEYYKSALSIYDNLSVPNQKVAANKAPLSLTNRNVQLFIAYSILWEAFNHIYTAAAYTAFAQSGAERDTLEDDRSKITRVLNAPILTDADFSRITLLKDGETPNGAINRMLNRSSRELKEMYGVGYDQTLTDMDAFLQGVTEATEVHGPDHSWLREAEHETWVVKALDSAGRPFDPESQFSTDKYRSVITWQCYQIRHNLNFVGKSDGSVDDAILIIRAFCLVEPVIGLLLNESKKEAIFAL